MLWTTETTIFIWTITKVFMQRKQQYILFNARVYKWNNSKNHEHNADNYFLNLR